MNDSPNQTPPSRSASLEDTLRTEARRIPAPEQPGFVSQVMQHVRATPRRAVTDSSEKNFGWSPWLMATAAVAATIVITIVVTSAIVDAPSPTTPRQANIPHIFEFRVESVLASREQDLAGELQRIRADLDSIGRMVSVRLESDSE